MEEENTQVTPCFTSEGVNFMHIRISNLYSASPPPSPLLGLSLFSQACFSVVWARKPLWTINWHHWRGSCEGSLAEEEGVPNAVSLPSLTRVLYTELAQGPD